MKFKTTPSPKHISGIAICLLLSMIIILWFGIVQPSYSQTADSDSNDLLFQLGEENASQTGLKIPRMVSVKASGVNVRNGPGVNFAVKWVLALQDMPVEIIAEYESWRKVRDWEGAEGWIFHSALSSKRSVMITNNDAVLRRLSSDSSPAVARLTQGLIGILRNCDEIWCFVNIQGYDGWIKRDEAWGIYPNEVFKK